MQKYYFRTFLLFFFFLFTQSAYALTEVHYSGALQTNLMLDTAYGAVPLHSEYERYNYSTIGGEIELRAYTQAQFSPGEYWSVGLYKTNPWTLIEESRIQYNADRDCIEILYNNSYWSCYWGNLNGAILSAIGTQWELTADRYYKKRVSFAYDATCLDDGEYTLIAEHAGNIIAQQTFRPTPFIPVITSALTESTIHPAIPLTKQPLYGTGAANSIVPATDSGKTFVMAHVSDSLGCNNIQFRKDTTLSIRSTVVPRSASHLHFTDPDQQGTGKFYQVDSPVDQTPTPTTSASPSEITLNLSDNGGAWAMYKAGEFGVDEKIEVSAESNVTGIRKTAEHALAIKVPGLVPLDTSGNLYYISGTGKTSCDKSHNDSANIRRSHYVRPMMAAMMEALARYYHDTTGLKISFNDTSLEYGGYFDKGKNLDLSQKCHLTHREGLDIDLNSAETATCPDEANLNCPMNGLSNANINITRLRFLTDTIESWNGYRWSEGENIHYRLNYLHE